MRSVACGASDQGADGADVGRTRSKGEQAERGDAPSDGTAMADAEGDDGGSGHHPNATPGGRTHESNELHVGLLVVDPPGTTRGCIDMGAAPCGGSPGWGSLRRVEAVDGRTEAVSGFLGQFGELGVAHQFPGVDRGDSGSAGRCLEYDVARKQQAG